ncbi:MAG: response regulator [Casimicrobiaceae bacterium]
MPAPEPALPPQTILAVDDTPDNLSLLAGLLGDRYRVKVATNGAKALELAASSPPDLILLDIMMRGVDGYEVLERLRADASLRQIPVVMISAVGEIESVIRCVELGAEDYLLKPFNPTLLRARVGATLEKKRLRDEVRAQAEQLADWNRKLEERVQEQLAQLDRLGRLKHYFSPHLAEAIINGGGAGLLQTHRREVVVAFLDMRGFTAFTDNSEPEEVMTVLGEYHRVMGRVIVAHEGTLEHFAGDGMMILFNDPIEIDDPIAQTVRMALAMQKDFGPLRAAWRKRGYDLDLGIGIAQGYATLGPIGFEERWEYACIGGVANLASRLCSEAKGGQILTNRKTLLRVEETVDAQALGEATLKGIAHPVPIFNITGFKAGAVSP